MSLPVTPKDTWFSMKQTYDKKFQFAQTKFEPIFKKCR